MLIACSETPADEEILEFFSDYNNSGLTVSRSIIQTPSVNSLVKSTSKKTSQHQNGDLLDIRSGQYSLNLCDDILKITIQNNTSKNRRYIVEKIYKTINLNIGNSLTPLSENVPEEAEPANALVCIHERNYHIYYLTDDIVNLTGETIETVLEKSRTFSSESSKSSPNSNSELSLPTARFYPTQTMAKAFEKLIIAKGIPFQKADEYFIIPESEFDTLEALLEQYNIAEERSQHDEKTTTSAYQAICFQTPSKRNKIAKKALKQGLHHIVNERKSNDSTLKQFPFCIRFYRKDKGLVVGIVEGEKVGDKWSWYN